VSPTVGFSKGHQGLCQTVYAAYLSGTREHPHRLWLGRHAGHHTQPHAGVGPHISPRILHAHGYSGHGVPTATLAGKLLADAIAGTAERFDVMAAVPSPRFPGGTLLRWPGLVAGMLYYSLRDRLG
jgi:glycine/D-amino acid oxidase-like deaminating enzyme